MPTNTVAAQIAENTRRLDRRCQVEIALCFGALLSSPFVLAVFWHFGMQK